MYQLLKKQITFALILLLLCSVVMSQSNLNNSFKANLQLVSLKVNGDMYQNKTGNFTATLKNNGNGAYNSRLWFYMEKPVVYSPHQLIGGEVYSIAANETKTITITGTVTLPPDTYNCNMIFDTNNNPSDMARFQFGSHPNVQAIVKDVNSGTNSVVSMTGNKVGVTVPIVRLDKYELELIVGEEQTLNATTTPAGQSVTWSSSNTSKVTVEGSYGQAKVVAKTSGTVNINATFGGQTVSCIVTVYDCFSQDYVTFDGVKWATRNVDQPGTFAAKASDAGMLYQWNRKIGWSPTDPLVNSNGSTQWDGSNPTGSSWEADNDPSPAGWRVPTYEEANALIRVTAGKRRIAIVNGIRCYLFGAAENSLLLPAYSARGTNGNLPWLTNEAATFWTSTEYNADGAYTLDLLNSLWTTYFGLRAAGVNVRSVKK